MEECWQQMESIPVSYTHLCWGWLREFCMICCVLSGCADQMCIRDSYNTTPAMEHRLELVGRERLTVSGVEDVGRFDETGIVMSTAAGTLVVTGEDLHIDKLSLDGGELHVDGRIDSVAYEDEGQGRSGFFSRLFG